MSFEIWNQVSNWVTLEFLIFNAQAYFLQVFKPKCRVEPSLQGPKCDLQEDRFPHYQINQRSVHNRAASSIDI